MHFLTQDLWSSYNVLGYKMNADSDLRSIVSTGGMPCQERGLSPRQGAWAGVPLVWWTPGVQAHLCAVMPAQTFQCLFSPTGLSSIPKATAGRRERVY